jgi:hypothetical protein
MRATSFGYSFIQLLPQAGVNVPGIDRGNRRAVILPIISPTPGERFPIGGKNS